MSPPASNNILYRQRETQRVEAIPMIWEKTPSTVTTSSFLAPFGGLLDGSAIEFNPLVWFTISIKSETRFAGSTPQLSASTFRGNGSSACKVASLTGAALTRGLTTSPGDDRRSPTSLVLAPRSRVKDSR